MTTGKNDTQGLLFQKIKEQIPPHTSLVDQVADILNISPDGVYRRIRGETPLRLDEAASLCQTFRISLDELTQQTVNHSIAFSPYGLGQNQMDFEAYLQSLLDILTHMQRMGVKESIHAAKDIPVFHLFPFPELALFKMFFWQKTIFSSPGLASRHFSIEVQNEKQERCVDLCRQIGEKYALIPTIEIWNEETAYSFIKQIGYYYESGLFASEKDAQIITEQVDALFTHLQNEAELGYKFLKGNPPKNRVKNFSLYYNDLILMDNVIAVSLEESSRVFLVYNSIEYLSTSNPVFFHDVMEWLKTLMQRSDLISAISERQRNKFFLKISKRMDRLKSLMA